AGLEQQWCQIAEIPLPDAPVVRALCFQKRMLDPRLLERLVQALRALHRGVVLTARDPQEIDLLVGLDRIGGEGGERLRLEPACHSGTHDANLTERLEVP